MFTFIFLMGVTGNRKKFITKTTLLLKGRLDLPVKDLILVELKAVGNVDNRDYAQVINHLRYLR
jgi:PD-(D/E)XK nuclease superfamily